MCDISHGKKKYKRKGRKIKIACSKKYKFVDSTFDLSDHIEKKRHLQVIIIVCSAILLLVMLVVGLVSCVRRMKLRNEGNL